MRIGVDGRSLRGCRYQMGCIGSMRLLMLEALAAKHGPPLCRLEGHGGLDAALGALGSGLGPRDDGSRRVGSGTQAYSRAFELTGFASLGIVLELLVEEEELFAGGEDEFTTTVCAG